MMHAQSHWKRVAIAGTAILLLMAVLTLPASQGGAKKVLDALAPLASHASVFFSAAYRAAPALTVGLVLAVCLPLVSGFVRMSKPLTRAKDATRIYKPRAGRIDPFDAAVVEDPAARRRHPFIEIENGRGMRCAILRDMLRIGREEDNDIRISSRYVHRYHAAIHRDDDDWCITDLTGVESNGLIVNGKRCCEARLHDGDLIQLGPGKLRFRVGAA